MFSAQFVGFRRTSSRREPVAVGWGYRCDQDLRAKMSDVLPAYAGVTCTFVVRARYAGEYPHRRWGCAVGGRMIDVWEGLLGHGEIDCEVLGVCLVGIVDGFARVGRALCGCDGRGCWV